MVGIDNELYGYKSELRHLIFQTALMCKEYLLGSRQSVTKNKSVGWENIFGYHQLNYKMMCMQRPLCISLPHRNAAEAPHLHARS